MLESTHLAINCFSIKNEKRTSSQNHSNLWWKIAKKGSDVGLSFYAFFANKNDDPERLMEAAHWWIMKHQLDHFEKATKIKALILSEST